MASTAAIPPRPDHVVVVMEENRGYPDIIGNPDAPFINSLADQGMLFTDYTAAAHPSQPNYLALFSGSMQGVTDDGTYSLSAPTLAGELTASGLSFIGYAESDSPRQHNPWESFSDSQGTGVDFSGFPGDFSQLPTVAFVVPGLMYDMHDGSVAQGDQWLQDCLGAYADWAGAHNSLLVVTFDEDDGTGGNRVATVIAGAHVARGLNGEAASHYGLLHTIQQMYGLPPLGRSGGAPVLHWSSAASSSAVTVSLLYQAAFGRLPDAPGLAYWVDRLAGGATLAEEAAGFANSPESLLRDGLADNAAFVTGLYRNTFARGADASGLAFWTNALNGGASRGDVLLGFAASTESQQMHEPGIIAAGLVPP